MLEAVSGMDRQSVFMRFFQNKDKFTEKEVVYFTDVDFKDHVALIVTSEPDENISVMGGGRYLAYDQPGGGRSAEVAFMVHDQHQGKGIATLIMKHLLKIAVENGISQFEAEVLPGNAKMLGVFSRSGLPMTRSHLGEVIHVTLALPSEITGPGEQAS